MILVDKMSKATHFVLVKSTLKSINIADIFMRKIFRLRRITKTVISIRDAKFTSNFWKSLFIRMNTNMNFSTTYHPQTDG